MHFHKAGARHQPDVKAESISRLPNRRIHLNKRILRVRSWYKYVSRVTVFCIVCNISFKHFPYIVGQSHEIMVQKNLAMAQNNPECNFFM
jgi:hypothetical protein